MQCFALSTLTFRTTPRQVYSYKTKIQKSTVFSWPLTSSYCLTPGPSYHQRDHEQIKLDDSLLMSLMSRTSKPWGFAALFKINSQKNSPSPSHGVFLTWMLVRFLIFSWLMDRNILDVKKKRWCHSHSWSNFYVVWSYFFFILRGNSSNKFLQPRRLSCSANKWRTKQITTHTFSKLPNRE